MGAKAGRKGARSYNILTCGVGAWRKYLDKCRRGTAKKAAIKEQECICGLITPNAEACRCGCGYCCPEERGG